MKTCWSIISTIVLAVLVILLIAFGGVRLFGLTPYMVTSGSMEPEYPVGSLIFVKEVPPEQIDVGDVITFRLTDGQTVATHQVYEADRAQEGSVKNFVALVKNGSFLVRIIDMTILIEKEFIYGSSKRPNPTDYYRKQHYQCG